MMTPELAYFLKINVAIALFYAFYRLFFYKDTFFHWRRAALLCFFAISLLYPLLNIQGWVKAHEPMVAMAGNNYTSGTNHHSTARTNNELARVNHTLYENHLLEWNISINNTFPCAIRQYHTATYPVP